MRIFDCFMYFDEELITNLRMNILDKYVDYFVIVESKYNHKGDKRDLKFNFKKYKKFKNKIIYLVQRQLPPNIEKIKKDDSNIEKEHKYINNAVKRENFQRNFLEKGIAKAKDDDLILISDVDEIPNLEKIKYSKIHHKILVFEQIMTYYKFNLALPKFIWHGTKGCLKKNLVSPQWLRNVKAKKYSKLRLDIFFNDKKFNNIKLIKEGGWHFTNVKKPIEIENKFKSYLHHREYELSGLNLIGIKKLVENGYAIYDLKADQRINKIGIGNKLKKINDKILPEYILKNKKKLINWFA